MVRVKRGGLLTRALRYPLVHRRDLAAVDRSPYPYGPCALSPEPARCWTLSALSVLHRWTGLTLLYEKEVEEDQ